MNHIRMYAFMGIKRQAVLGLHVTYVSNMLHNIITFCSNEVKYVHVA